jgi:hypothetical protein
MLKKESRYLMLDKNKKDRLEELLKIVSISDEELEKLTYKEKQKYYRAKNKLCKVVFVSRNKRGKGLTYRKTKEVKNERIV